MKLNTNKLIKIVGLLLFVTIFLSGCISYDSGGNPTGWVYEYIGIPTSNLLDWLAQLFGGSYGIAIIIVTLVTRLFMLPSSLKMTKNSMISQAKMKIAQPEIDEIKAEIEATDDPQLKTELNNEMMAVYKKYDINMFGGFSGCLPLVLQLPIISAVYAAIRSSEQIKNSSFLGIHLGETSIVLAVIVILVYVLQGWLTTRIQPQSDNPQAKQTNQMMLLMNPIMIGWISWSSAAGLGLYFLAGGIFAVLQQLYTNYKVRPRIEAIVEADKEKYSKLKRTPRVRTSIKKSSGESRLVPTKNEVRTNRNAGKQKRK